MIGIVLVTHGKLAREFLAALEHVVGPQQQAAAVCIEADDDMEKRRAEILQRVAECDSGQGVVLLTDIVVFALFATSLGLLMGSGGMISFGHAAYFGAGAYAAAIAAKSGLPFLPALVVGAIFAGLLALVFGWFAVRASGVSLAMLTLAFSQITWAGAFQWDAVTGGRLRSGMFSWKLSNPAFGIAL